jgi:hypothetical protein
MNNEDIYELSDFYCVAALVAQGFEIEALDKTSPKRCIFAFKNTEALQKAINHFWLRKTQLNVHTIFEAQRYVKNMMYSETNHI